MSTKTIWSNLFHSRKILIVFCSFLAVAVIGLGCGAWIMSEEKDVTVSVNSNDTVVSTYTNTVEELLEEQDIDLDDVSSTDVPLDSEIYDGQTVQVAITNDYTILVEGKTLKVSMAATDVGDVLEKAGVALGEYDIVEPSVSTAATTDLVIDIHRVTIEEEIRETELAYSVETQKDSTMFSGEEKVIQKGEAGLQTDTYLVTYRDGEYYSEELVTSEVTEPVTEIVAVGTLYSTSYCSDNEDSENESTASDLVAPNGMSCSKVITCKATAYHESEGSLTKSGTLSRVGAIAVDPSVIPLGTKLYVEGYGYCVAEDTGGLIKGYRIDVYFNSDEECINWGVKNVTVYILD
jgi:uncharacterized protein YabE (DUF348 family)